MRTLKPLSIILKTSIKRTFIAFKRGLRQSITTLASLIDLNRVNTDVALKKLTMICYFGKSFKACIKFEIKQSN